MGSTITARSEIFRLSRVMATPFSRTRAISPHRCFKSMTVPVPSRFTAFSWNTPLGSRFSANLPYSLMTVCPALLPP